MKVYQLIREVEEQTTVGDVRVLVCEHGAVGNVRHRVRHSPTGMNWGYSGSGPADCARSIAWDYLGREPNALEYQAVKRQLIAPMPVAGGQITEDQLRNVLEEVWREQREQHEVGGEA